MATNITRAKGVGSPTAVVHCRRLNETPTLVSGQKWYTMPMDPFNPTVYTPAVNGLAGAYEFYRIRSATVTLVPSGGSLNVGSLRCCFVNNPEMMNSALNGTTTVKSSVLYNEQGCTIIPFSTGGVKKLDTSRVQARRWYSTNFLTSYIDDENLDRTLQTTFHGEFIRPDGGANTNCTLIYDVVIEFSGLGRSSVLTMYKSIGTYVVPFVPAQGEDDDDFPTEVELITRSGKRSLYIKPAPPKP